jgi:hypothetical protein
MGAQQPRPLPKDVITVKPHFRIRFQFKPIRLPLAGTWFMAAKWWALVPHPDICDFYAWAPVVATAASGIRSGGLRN